MNDLLPGVPYIYGREAGPNEKVFTLETVESLCKEIKKLQDELLIHDEFSKCLAIAKYLYS